MVKCDHTALVRLTYHNYFMPGCAWNTFVCRISTPYCPVFSLEIKFKTSYPHLLVYIVYWYLPTVFCQMSVEKFFTTWEIKIFLDAYRLTYPGSGKVPVHYSKQTYFKVQPQSIFSSKNIKWHLCPIGYQMIHSLLAN